MSADMAIEARWDVEGLGTTNLELLKRPLDFIVADHHRLRSLCQILENLAGTQPQGDVPTEAILRCIEHDLPIHVIDEEEDLFPLLRRRASLEDGVERVLGLLSREHVEDDQLAGIIIRGLRGGQGADDPGRGDADEFRAALHSFARRQRRHIAVENAIVIPLAELRLTAKDREGLARRMAARRGILLSEKNRG